MNKGNIHKTINKIFDTYVAYLGDDDPPADKFGTYSHKLRAMVIQDASMSVKQALVICCKDWGRDDMILFDGIASFLEILIKLEKGEPRW